MVNSNPETVSTDYDTSDHLFFEPLTAEDVLNICDRMNPDGLIVQFGGQTPLNLARALADAGAPIIGTSVDSIDVAEDRELFQELVERLGLKQPANGTALRSAAGRPRRPPHRLSGAGAAEFRAGRPGMEIVYDEPGLSRYVEQAIEVSPGKPILIDKFLESAVEVDVDCLSDGQRTVIGGVMQHIEEAGIHSGDSACVIPPHSLPPAVVEEISRQTRELARELKVKGLMNVQFAVTNLASRERKRPEEARNTPVAYAPGSPVIYVLEVNPRASRTVPFVSKATGVPLARLASLVMVGKTLDELGLFDDAVADAFLGQGERLSLQQVPRRGHHPGPGDAFDRRGDGHRRQFPDGVRQEPDGGEQRLADVGRRSSSRWPTATSRRRRRWRGRWRRWVTSCSRRAARRRRCGRPGSRCEEVPKIQEGRPNLIDYMKNGKVALVINTPSGKGARTDEGKIRAAAVAHGVTCITTLAAAQAAVEACRALHQRELTVSALQDRFPPRK